MTLRARDHYTSSTLIGGQGGTNPNTLHTMLDGPTEYVNARWMESLHGIEWIVCHGHLDFFQKPLHGGRPNTKNMLPWHFECSPPLNYSYLSYVRTCMNENSLK